MKIAKDKWKHFFVGIVMGAVLQILFSSRFGYSAVLSLSLALLVSFVISYGFELFSKFTGKGYYEVMDAVAAEMGAAVGIALVLLAKFL